MQAFEAALEQDPRNLISVSGCRLFRQCWSRTPRTPFLLWMQAFEAALEQDPKNAEVASRLGKCLVMVHEYR